MPDDDEGELPDCDAELEVMIFDMESDSYLSCTDKSDVEDWWCDEENGYVYETRFKTCIKLGDNFNDAVERGYEE